jgi:hypothetical protein
LCAGEGGIAVWGFLASYAVALDRAPVSERVRALVPHFLVTALWFGLYRVRGYGVYGSGSYVDLLSQPGAYLALLPTRLRVMSGALLSVPAGLYRAWPAASVLAARVASVLLCGTSSIYFIRAARTDRQAAFWLLSSVTTALPFCCAPPSAHLLLTPGIAVSALLALPIARALGERAEHAETAPFVLPQRAPRVFKLLLPYLPPASVVSGVLAALILTVHVFGAAVWIPLQFRQLAASVKWPRQLAATLPLPLATAAAADMTVFVLNTPNYLLTATAPVSRELGPDLGPFFVLGSSRHTVTVTRVSETLIELAPAFGYVEEASAALVRDPKRRFIQGATHRLGPALLRVAELTPEGRVARLEIELENPADPRFVWTYWDGGKAGYRAVTLPPLGTAVQLPMTALPFAVVESQVWF